MMITRTFRTGKFAMFGLVLCATLFLGGCGDEDSGSEGHPPGTSDTVVSAPPAQGPGGGASASDTISAQLSAGDSAAAAASVSPEQQKITAEYLAARTRLVNIITSIRSENELRISTPMLTAAYTDVADVIIKYKGKPEALKAAHTGPQVKALDQRLAAHLQQLSAENPAALQTLTEAMQRYGAVLARLEDRVFRHAMALTTDNDS